MGLVLLLLTVQAAFPIRRTAKPAAQGWIETASGMLLTLALTAGLAWVVWRVAGRSRRKAAIACLIGTALSAFSAVEGRRRAGEEAAAWADLREEENAIRAELAREQNGGAPTAPGSAIARLERKARAYRAFARRVHDENGRAFGALAGVLEELAASGRAREEARTVFEREGGLDPATMTTLEAVAARLARLDALVAASRSTAGAYLSLGERARAAMGRADVPDDLATVLAAEFENESSIHDVPAVLEAAEGMWALGRERLVLLRDQWPRWRWDANDNTVVFDDSAAADRYNELAASLDAAVLTLTSLQDSFRTQVRELAGDDQ